MAYYIALQSKSHAFLLERRLRGAEVECELVFVPREITRDLCSMGVKLDGIRMIEAREVIKHSGLPGCRIFKEVDCRGRSYYVEEGL